MSAREKRQTIAERIRLTYGQFAYPCAVMTFQPLSTSFDAEDRISIRWRPGLPDRPRTTHSLLRSALFGPQPLKHQSRRSDSVGRTYRRDY